MRTYLVTGGAGFIGSNYIQNYLNATIGNEYANPYGQNRIIIIK